jgi:hypothetical protein
MAKVKVTTEASKETYELLLGVAKMIKIVKGAAKDGFQPGSDIPVIIASAIGDLVPAIQGVELIKSEIAEDKVAFSNAVSLGGAAIIEAAKS